jgi:hypothetical protein
LPFDERRVRMTARAKSGDEGFGDEGIGDEGIGDGRIGDGRLIGGLEGREGGGLRLGLLSLLTLFDHLVYQKGDGAFALGGFADLGGRGEDSEFGVSGDLFDNFNGFGSGVAVGGGFGEVEAGDLETVEEEAGTAGVDVVGGDALEDLADGELDGGSVFWEGKVEGGAAATAGAGVCGGLACGVVVVTEVFSAEAGAAAAVAVGEDVAALEAFGWFGLRCLGLRLDGVVHGSLPGG